MTNKLIVNSLELFKKIVINPAQLFKHLERSEYEYSVYFLFFVSGLIPFYNSFSMEKQNINFYSNSTINEIMSFLSTPQITLILTFLSFIFFIVLIWGFCRILLKGYNNRKLIVCFLSISSAGILLQILFYFLQLFVVHEVVYWLSYIGFIWIVSLSVIAVKNSQNTSYMKSIMIYIFSAIPVVLIIGLTGLAPFLLWIV